MLTPYIGHASGIEGFRDFQFGMSVGSVEAMGALVPQENGDMESGQWYSFYHPEIVDGVSYRVALQFNRNDEMINVNLSRRTDAHDALCTSQFSSTLSSLQAAFGTPDQPPERLTHGGIMTTTTARFSFRDGSRVTLTTIFISDCSISVSLMAAREGGGF